MEGHKAISATTSSSSTSSFLDGATFDEFSQQLFSTLVTATKHSNEMGEKYDVYSSSLGPSFDAKMQHLGSRLLNMTQQLLNQGRPGNPPDVMMENTMVDDVTRFGDVVDVMDDMFEGVDMFVDQSTQPKEKGKEIKPIIIRPKGSKNNLVFHADNIGRPQDRWGDEIDNSYGPVVPKLAHKHHARVPLDARLLKAKDNVKAPVKMTYKPSVVRDDIFKPWDSYPHPYEYELANLEITPSHLAPAKVQIYGELDKTPVTWVDTSSQLSELLGLLMGVPEFAVDLEYHAYRSFQGFTCLMQVSTRTQDFLIDTIELRSELHKFNEVFANPAIVKVLHGADRDIEWLQHDFSVYVVNMFDTGQAMRVLDFPHYSLAHLLKHYCNLNVDKKYQLADWRVRPIPEEMKKYAREDTHYLLYIYDRLKNEALERSNENQNVLRSIWTRSRDVCMNMYEKVRFSFDDYKQFAERYNVTFSSIQNEVLGDLYEWRDRTARLEDESHRYVLPNHMLLQIATVMPVDVNSLFACCKPVPPLVKLQATQLTAIIQQAKDRCLYPSGRIEAQQGAFAPYSRTQQLQQPYYREPYEVRVNLNLNLLSPAPLRSHTSSAAPSPVLTTEQLYRTALWNDDPDNVTLLPSQSALVSKYNEDFMSHRPFSFSLFADEDEDEDEEDEDDGSGAAAARRTARMVARSWIQSPTKAAAQAFGVMETSEAPRPLPFSLTSSTENIMQVISVKENTKENEKESDDDDDDEDDDDEEEEEEDGKPVSLEDIPKSMAEIYQLSNQTRIKKKQKKKLKRKMSASLPTSPLLIKNGDGILKKDVHVNPSKKVNDDTPEDPHTSIAFMQSIGWLQEESSQLLSSVQPITQAPIEKSKSITDKPPWKRNKMQQQSQQPQQPVQPNKPGATGRGGSTLQNPESGGRGMGNVRGRGRRGGSTVPTTATGRGNFIKPARVSYTGRGRGGGQY